MKGQAAFEYMAIFIIVMAFVTPVWFYVISLQGDTTNDLYFTYAKNAADKITQTADLVYSQGYPAKLRVKVYMPPNILEAFFDDKTVVLKMAIDSHETYITSLSTGTLTGSLPTSEGVYWLDVEAENDHVQISYT
ncbi:MAG: hypothetical protein KKB03_04475 [Nanoarchaeota archaeon]|nr:hypothetical protein [Nanoarchaeota archaeon]MBU1135430.1 hypothetical protein [Nanoarchaeota archaeon]MBU2520469.1 hypothetical protein [Nanoarchaeota archaeon]